VKVGVFAAVRLLRERVRQRHGYFSPLVNSSLNHFTK
jgi:hypothetical protein